MRRVYIAWAIGLLLKLVGASWDVAWHFRYLREAISPPHIINLAGELVVGLCFLYEWRTRAPHRRGPLLVVLVGAALFALAIPFDQWWHVTFGIDITTWSPAHLLLFSGTAVGVAGIVLLFLADLRHERGGTSGATWRERAMLVLLLVMLAEAFAFPLTYNEYATIGARDACSATPTIDPVLVATARLASANCANVDAAAFYNTPLWLYPVYSIVFAVFLATLVRAALGPGWAAAMLVGLSVERAVANGVIAGLGWPAAVVPLQYVAMAVLLEAAWIVPAPARARAAAGAVAAGLAAYVAFVSPPPWLPSVPLDASSAPLGLALALAFALLAFELQLRSPAWMARVPPWEDAPERLTAWAREKWAAR
jgi:hypothetical protein